MKHNRMFLFLVMVTLALTGGIAPMAAESQPPAASQAYGWMDWSSHLPETGGLTDVHFLGNQGWVTGGFEKVCYTPDGGQTFSVQNLPSGAGISNSVFVRSASEGYLVTSTGKVLYSTDPANGNWTVIASPGGTLYSIHFPPSGVTGYACGNSGRIYRVTSSSVEMDTTISTVIFTSVVFPVSFDQGWVVGENTLRHRIGGAWTDDQNYYAGNSYNAIHLVDNQNGWVVGDYGVIIHTSDGGNWNGQINPDVQQRSLNDVFFLNQSEGWAVGSGGAILHTTDGSTTPDGHWHLEGEAVAANRSLNAVYAVDSHTVYVVGNGVFLKYGAIELPYRVYLPFVIRQ